MYMTENKFVCQCGIILKKYDKRHEVTKRHIEQIKTKLKTDNTKLKTKIETNKITMNANQLLFINSDIKNCIMLGNPGCGKTKTIIEYCVDKYNKKIIKSSNNFLIISFSKKAQIDFINRGKLSLYPKLFNNKNVRTIH